jgi:hypothetical protein
MLFVCDYILFAALGRCFSAQEVQKTSSIFRLEAPAGRSLIMHFCKKSSSIISASRSSYSQVSSHESVPTYSAIPTKLVCFLRAPHKPSKFWFPRGFGQVRKWVGRGEAKSGSEGVFASPCGRVVLRRRENAPRSKGILLYISNCS